MNRFLVCSDIHRRIENFRYALTEGKMEGIEGVIIAGDVEVDYSVIRDLMSEVFGEEVIGVKLYIVKGNCDGSNLAGVDDMITFNLNEKVTCLLTHGHKYQVKYDLDTLEYVSSYRKAKVAIYGHTHMYDNHVSGGVRFINPGALCGGFDKPSYIILTVDGSHVDVLKRVIN